METTEVRVRLSHPNGEPVIGGVVVAHLESAGISELDGMIDLARMEDITDENGQASLLLWPSVRGMTAAAYRVIARSRDGRKVIDGRIHVPESEAPVWLQDILQVPPPSTRPYDTAAIAAITQDRVLARQAANEAAAAAEQTADDRRQTGEDREATQAAREAAENLYGDLDAVNQARLGAEAARDGAVSARDDAEQSAEAVAEAMLRAPVTLTEADMKDPPANGAVDPIRLFSMSAKEELAHQLTGQNRDLGLPQIPGSIMGECQFVLHCMYNTSKNHVGYPLISRMTGRPEGSNRIRCVPLAEIRAIVNNRPANIPLFEPKTLTYEGICTFTYRGKEPLHTIIRGSFNLLHRITGSGNVANVSLWLRLVPVPMDPVRPTDGRAPTINIPGWEAGGQNRGRQTLSWAAASLRNPPEQLIQEEFRDKLGAGDSQLEEAVANNPNLNTKPVVNGFISSVLWEEGVLPPDHPQGGPAPPELQPFMKTTGPIPVEPGMYYLSRTYPALSSSSRARIIFLNEEGTPIEYDNFGTGNQIIQIPDDEDITHMQIYFARSTDSAENLVVKHVPASQVYRLNVNSGVWVRYNFAVCEQVVFYPNTTYMLEISPLGGIYNRATNSYTAQPRSYKVESGGLSFTFDASRYMKEMAQYHMEEGR